MGIIQTIITKRKEKITLRNDLCDSLITQIDIALKEIGTLFSDSHSFVEPTKENEWCNRNTSLIVSVCITNIKKLKRAKKKVFLVTVTNQESDFASLPH